MQEVIQRIEEMQTAFIEALTSVFERLGTLEEQVTRLAESVEDEPDEDLVSSFANRLADIKADTEVIKADAAQIKNTLSPPSAC